MYLSGSKVVDAKRGISVEVTQDDLCHAVPMDPANCAFAIAMKRAFRGCIRAEVYKSRTYIFTKWRCHRLSTPRAANFQAVMFDKTEQFQLGKYYFNPISPSSRLTGKRQGSIKPKGAPRLKPGAKKRAAPHKVDGARPDFKSHE
jgi:hypothetical protein